MRWNPGKIADEIVSTVGQVFRCVVCPGISREDNVYWARVWVGDSVFPTLNRTAFGQSLAIGIAEQFVKDAIAKSVLDL